MTTKPNGNSIDDTFVNSPTDRTRQIRGTAYAYTDSKPVEFDATNYVSNNSEKTLMGGKGPTPVFKKKSVSTVVTQEDRKHI